MSKQRVDIAELRAAKRRAMTDTSIGVVSYRAWLYSGNEAGQQFGKPGDHDIPTGHAPHVGGTVGSPIVDPRDNLFRAAGLTPDEIPIAWMQAEGYKHAEIAERLGISVYQLRRRVGSANRKLVEHGKILAALRGDA